MGIDIYKTTLKTLCVSLTLSQKKDLPLNSWLEPSWLRAASENLCADERFESTQDTTQRTLAHIRGVVVPEIRYHQVMRPTKGGEGGEGR